MSKEGVGTVEGTGIPFDVWRGPTPAVSEGRQTLGQGAASNQRDELARCSPDLLGALAEVDARHSAYTLGLARGSLQPEHEVGGVRGRIHVSHSRAMPNRDAAPPSAGHRKKGPRLREGGQPQP